MTRNLLLRCALIIGAGLLMPSVSRAASNLVVIPTKLDADWESGTWDSGLTPAPDPSFQNEGDTNVTTVADTNRYVEASTNFARSGSYSFKAFGQPPAMRSEIAFMNTAYRFRPGDESYYAVSYCPDSSWLATCPWSIILTQWKTFSSGPSAVFRLTNDGTHRPFFAAAAGGTPDYYFAALPLNEWTDFVFYFKWSINSDGVTKIWRNGTLVLDITGPTLLTAGDGYMKIGMYTEIDQPRSIYIDDVRIGTNVLVNTWPVFASDPVSKAGATEDAAYTGQTLSGSASDADSSDPLTYSKVSGPAWLSIASNGALSGAPANPDVGTNSWTVRVSDGNGGTGSATLNITVANVNDAPVFTVDPMSCADASVGFAYSGQTLGGSATDVDVGASLTYSKVSGPAWLSIATNGALTGTPASTNAGANSWTVQVSDGTATDTALLNINVVNTFTSVSAEDGWVLESAETSNIGGTSNRTDSTASALRIGDDSSKRQYKTVVSFDTSALPDGATIISATLKLLRGAVSSTPTSLGSINVDIIGGTGFNGAVALTKQDFEAAAGATGVATMSYPSANGIWSTGALNAAGLAQVNKTGTTQLRVYFATDDDNDGTADYLGFYSGEGAAGNKPELVITYNVEPSVSLTAPTNNASFTAPASIALTADASDTDGTIAAVGFYNGSTLLGFVTNSPYAYTWTNVLAGSYNLTARATDNAGAVNTSAVARITVVDATYALAADAGSNGVVTPASTNVLAGGSATFIVTASNFYRIATLTQNGTPVAGMSFDNSSTTTNFIWSNVQTSGVLAATFTAQVTTNTPASVPYEWLAVYGLTNYNTDAVADSDSDGLLSWQEYITGTDPTNTTSCFKAVQNTRDIITWSAASGRVYSVYWSTNLMQGFQPLETNLPYPRSSYTNAIPDSRVNHYQIKVRLQ